MFYTTQAGSFPALILTAFMQAAAVRHFIIGRAQQ